MQWNSLPIYILDFEGTRKSGVVEVGVVCLELGEIKSAETFFCKPKSPLSAPDLALCKISEDDINNQKDFFDYFEYFKACRNRGFFGAHSVSVEEGLLRDAFPTPGYVPNFLTGGEASIWGPWLDTLSLYRAVYPGLESFKLRDLIEVFDLKESLKQHAEIFCPKSRRHYHAALFDALASALLLKRLVQEDGFEEVTIHWLLRYSSSNPLERSGQLHLGV